MVMSDSIFYPLTRSIGASLRKCAWSCCCLQAVGVLRRNKTHPDPPVDRIGWLRRQKKKWFLKEMSITGTMAVCYRAGNPARGN